MSVQAILLPLFVEVVLTFVLLFILAPMRTRDFGSGAVRPGDLVTRIIGLSEVPAALAAMSTASTPGVTVIHPLAGR